jgi:O-antigen/teichoic acid export membrane protein
MSGRAEWFMVTMFKEEFHESTYVLELLGIAIVFRLVIFLLSHIIYAQDHERFMAKAMTFLAAFSFGGSILLIPRFGAIAAASVFLASESLMAMICFYKSERVLGFPRLWRMLVLPVIGGLLSYVVLVCSSSYALAGMFGSVLVFFGFLFIFRFYSYVEVLWLFKLLTKFKQAKGSEKT